MRSSLSLWSIRPPQVLAASALALLALLACLAPSASAQELAVEETASAHAELSTHPQEPAQCQDTLAFIEPEVGVCNFCNLPNCGCIHIEGCVLVYSCSCSPIQCTRSCDNKFCRV